VLSRDGDPGHNYLCAGLELFFTHTRPAMQTMARLLQRGRPPADVMALTAAMDEKRRRNQPCPCASGRRFRSCHGNNAPCSPFSGLKPATDSLQDGSPTFMQVDSLPQTRAGPAPEVIM
jgi:uncharacterized protein